MYVHVLPPSFLWDLLLFLSTMFWDAIVSTFSDFCSSVFSIYLNQFKNVSPCYWRYTSERTLTFSYDEHPVRNIFAEASGVRMLECLSSNIWGSGLGEDFSGRSFQKVYKNVHSHVSYLSSASRMWNLWLRGQIKSATFSFFVLANKAWLEHSHQLVTNCLQLLLWNSGRAESLLETSWPAQSEIFTIHPLQKKFANHYSISL